jgi:hypothetical protein
MTTPIYIEIKWYNICDTIIISIANNWSTCGNVWLTMINTAKPDGLITCQIKA